MKKLNLILAILFLFLIYSNAEAQLLAKYTADEGLETAIEFTKSDLDFQSPVLIAVATMKQEVEASGITVKPGMSITNGKSEAWVYVILDEDTEETAVVGVIKIFVAFQALDLSNQSGFEVPGFVSEPITGNWIDSEEIVDDVSANSTYQNYIKANPTAEPQTSALSVNTTNSMYMMNYPYWINTFGENEDLVCYTDALTGETDCQTISNVKYVESITNSFAPNPANNYINIKLNNNTSKFDNIRIVDIFGNIVYQTSNPSISLINVTSLANGSYTIMYEYKNKIEIEKLLIQK
jgi:hypothetical protein